MAPRPQVVAVLVPSESVNRRLAQAPLQRDYCKCPTLRRAWISSFRSTIRHFFFVTFNTHHRRRLLANAQLNNELVAFAKSGEQRAIAVGRYVIMLDHIHIFVSGHQDFLLTQWVRLLKRALSKVISQSRPHWQKGFFDHLIRHGESYSEKWEYVRQNPVRAGLVETPEDWPWQGEIVPIDQQSVDRETL